MSSLLSYSLFSFLPPFYFSLFLFLLLSSLVLPSPFFHFTTPSSLFPLPPFIFLLLSSLALPSPSSSRLSLPLSLPVATILPSSRILAPSPYFLFSFLLSFPFRVLFPSPLPSSRPFFLFPLFPPFVFSLPRSLFTNLFPILASSPYFLISFLVLSLPRSRFPPLFPILDPSPYFLISLFVLCFPRFLFSSPLPLSPSSPSSVWFPHTE